MRDPIPALIISLYRARLRYFRARASGLSGLALEPARLALAAATRNYLATPRGI